MTSKALMLKLLGATLVAAILISALFFDFARDEFAVWLSTLLATFIGAFLAVAGGLVVFDIQSQQAEENKADDLRESLIAELYATRDRLRTQEVQRVHDPTGGGGPTVGVVLAHLEPTVCEEVIRSAIFGHVNTVSLTYLARLMRDYTKRADDLLSLLYGPQVDNPLVAPRIYELAKNTKRLQEFVLLYCDTILEGFAAQGLDLPTDEAYFSDPSRQAPEDFGL